MKSVLVCVRSCIIKSRACTIHLPSSFQLHISKLRNLLIFCSCVCMLLLLLVFVAAVAGVCSVLLGFVVYCWGFLWAVGVSCGLLGFLLGFCGLWCPVDACWWALQGMQMRDCWWKLGRKLVAYLFFDLAFLVGSYCVFGRN